MKKYVQILFLCLMCAFVINCGGQPKDQASKTNIDLTRLSATMLYAEVYNIMTAPEKYIGKTIKISGVYNLHCLGENCYRFLMVTDAGGCCPMGLEIFIDDKYAYPENGADIEVSGEVKSYETSGEAYYCLYVDDIKILKKKDK
jgi:uncharacterized membrane protein YcgQ (UPF0703/DUF1980 family)